MTDATEVDQYIKEVVQRGDEGSALLAARCTPTLKNSDHVQVLREGMNGLAVLRIPEDYAVVVHSAAGDPDILDTEKHTASLIDRLFEQTREIDAIPLGLANVIDASKGDRPTVEAIANALVRSANKYEFAIMNGELAILGNRINCDANVSGTMVSLAKVVPRAAEGRRSFSDGSSFAVFYPKGLAVYMNSDGVGTKTEFYERARKYIGALRDSLAMKLDDAAKIGAKAKVVFDVVETKGQIPILDLEEAATLMGEEMGFAYLLHHEAVGNRLGGWSEQEPTFNVSGSAVNVIDEERLRSPLMPHAGDYVIAIRGKPNPRSNGITDKRKIMIKQFGEDWHNTPEGKQFLEFLAEPSTIFYPVFSALIEQGCATSIFHMSGGAYNGKLARPLAGHGLYAALEGLFEPDWRELALGGFSFTPAEVAYAKWPMGNEGFLTTGDPEKAMHIIAAYGLEARYVGHVEKAADGRTGVELVGIKDSGGKNVYFRGH